jgi:aminoglycoside phosphotransferase (APT) family kinase protein
VLRRYRGIGHPEREALVIRHARAHGFPVPEVVEVRDNAIVLERIDGPSMWADLRRRPWRARSHMRSLAHLHGRLHAIDAPAELNKTGEGTSLLHLDFHPDNVLLSARGPVVIDWTNARPGPALLDVAMTWVICATSGGVLGPMVVRSYLGEFDRESVRAYLPAAAERRLADSNVTDDERKRVRRLLSRSTG